MINAVRDPKTGAILFKKDQEGRNVDYLMNKIAELEKKNKELEARIQSIENMLQGTHF